MSPMSDQPLTRVDLTQALMEFHRDVFRPDFQRDIQEATGAIEQRILTRIDGLAHALQNLRAEQAAVKVELARVEERLDRVEQRLDRVDQRLDGLDARLGTMEQQYADLVASFHRLEERLSRMEARLEELSSDGGRPPVTAEVERLRVRVDALHDEIRRLDERVRRARGE